MGISVGDAILYLKADTSGMDKEMKSYFTELNKQMDDAVKSIQSSMRIAGAAILGLGAAGLKMVSDAKKMNAQLGQTAITLGITSEQARDLALSITDVSTPLDDVIRTMELLARAGVRDIATLKENTRAFDALGDATGATAQEVANTLIPAFKVFGVTLPKTTAEMDKFTWLTKNTTVDLSEFGSAMQFVAMYGQGLNITIDDMIGIMAALEARGITGSAATRLFRTAVNQAKDGAASLNDVLGVSKDQIKGYIDKISQATGITEKYADVANSQYGIMDKVKQLWSELTLKVGTIIDPLEGVFGALTTVGTVMVALSLVNIPKLIAMFNLLKTAVFSFYGTLLLIPAAIAAVFNIMDTLNEHFKLPPTADDLARFWPTLEEQAEHYAASAGNATLSIYAYDDSVKRTVIDTESWAEQTARQRYETSLLGGAIEDVATATEEAAVAAEKLAANEAAYVKDKDAIQKLKDAYGDLGHSARTWADLARAAAATASQALDRELDAARKNYNTQMGYLSDLYSEKIRVLNAGADAAISAIQEQIDAIDEQTESEERALQDAADNKRMAELLEAGDMEGYFELVGSASRRHLLQQREDEKDALRASIDDIRESTQTQVDALTAELAALQQNEADKLAATESRLEQARKDLDAALQAELERLAVELQAKVDAEIAKLDATKDRLAAEEAATRDSEKTQLIAAAEYQAALEATLKDIIQTITTIHVDKYSTGVGETGSSTETGGTWRPPSLGPFEEMWPTLPLKGRGGVIPEPTVLYGLRSLRPYAIAGEAGIERIVPDGEGSTGFKSADIRIYFDGRLVASKLGAPLVDVIRVMTGVKN